MESERRSGEKRERADGDASPQALAADQPLPFPDHDLRSGEPERQKRESARPRRPEREDHQRHAGRRAQRQIGAEVRAPIAEPGLLGIPHRVAYDADLIGAGWAPAPP